MRPKGNQLLCAIYGKMKVCVSVTVLLALLALVAGQGCQQEVNCILLDNCFCAVSSVPLGDETPQFITISFNDAISELYYLTYYEPLLGARANPDGGKISATFYVPHEYTDYKRVNDLYNAGYEIASHSITKNPISDYWLNADVETLVAEFQGQAEIISKFANIPLSDITGARVPNFELTGDSLFQAYAQAGIQYDATWTTRSSEQYFPFTLDFSDQVNCNIGVCPAESHPGIWVAPNIDLIGDEIECNNLQACRIAGTVEEISDWLQGEFLKLYGAGRAPMNLVVSAAWFMTTPNAFEGLSSFLDGLQAYTDVFLVSHRQVVDWAQNPVPAVEYSSVLSPRAESCSARSCPLAKDEETRYMVSCVPCPAVFPWLGNPEGSLQ